MASNVPAINDSLSYANVMNSMDEFRAELIRKENEEIKRKEQSFNKAVNAIVTPLRFVDKYKLEFIKHNKEPR